jgi:hypothetical protein
VAGLFAYPFAQAIATRRNQGTENRQQPQRSNHGSYHVHLICGDAYLVSPRLVGIAGMDELRYIPVFFGQSVFYHASEFAAHFNSRVVVSAYQKKKEQQLIGYSENFYCQLLCGGVVCCYLR